MDFLMVGLGHDILSHKAEKKIMKKKKMKKALLSFCLHF